MAFNLAIRKNSTGEIQVQRNNFDIRILDVNDIEGQIFYYTEGNGGCDHNLCYVFDEETEECKAELFTALYIELDDGRRIDLHPDDELPTNYAKCPLCGEFLYRPGLNFYCERCNEPFWNEDIIFSL